MDALFCGSVPAIVLAFWPCKWSNSPKPPPKRQGRRQNVRLRTWKNEKICCSCFSIFVFKRKDREKGRMTSLSLHGPLPCLAPSYLTISKVQNPVLYILSDKSKLNFAREDLASCSPTKWERIDEKLFIFCVYVASGQAFRLLSCLSAVSNFVLPSPYLSAV